MLECGLDNQEKLEKLVLKYGDDLTKICEEYYE